MLISNEKLDVTLLIKRVASPADAQFIGFELNNQTGQAIDATMVHYRFNTTILTPEGKPLLHSNLASGNSYDLIWRDGPPPPDGPRKDEIPPGITTRLQYTSNYSFALLKWPTAEARVIEGHAHFILAAATRTPPGGVPFRFEWVAPDDAGLEALRKRLADGLATPRDWLADGWFISTALQVPAIASGVTPKQLLAALTGRDQQRDYLVRFINERYPKDAAVRDYYLDVLQRRDRWALKDLAWVATDVSEAQFVEPAMQILRDKNGAILHYDTLRIAARCSAHSSDPAAVRRELGQFTLARCTLVAGGAAVKKEEVGRLADELRELGATHDSTLVPKLRRYLDETVVVTDAKMMSVVNNGVSIRLCDIAYNTVLNLRDDRKTARFSLMNPLATERSDLVKQRDDLIAAMRSELDRKQ